MKKEASKRNLDIPLSQRQENAMSAIVSATIKIGTTFIGIEPQKFNGKEEMIKNCSKCFIERYCVKINGEEASSPSFTRHLFDGEEKKAYWRELLDYFKAEYVKQLKEYYPPELLDPVTIRVGRIEVVYWKADFPDKTPDEMRFWFWSLNLEDEISFYNWCEDYCKEMLSRNS